jgi:PleD family two-component response regulator
MLQLSTSKKSLEIGMNDYISKPIDEKIIIQ